MTLPRVSLEDLESVITGKWGSAGYFKRLKLSATERERFEEAKACGYLTFRGRANVLNVWFHWCENTQHPYVYIRQARRYAHVCVDLIAQVWQLSGPQKARILEYPWGSPPWARNSRRYMSSVRCDVYGVPLAEAPALAQVMLDAALASKPVEDDKQHGQQG